MAILDRRMKKNNRPIIEVLVQWEQTNPRMQHGKNYLNCKLNIQILSGEQCKGLGDKSCFVGGNL